jgi:glucokinase
MLIAGDIGGTKTLLAICSPEGGARAPLAQSEFHSASYSGLEPMVREFLKATGQSAEIGCFDVAGPVLRGEAHLTNLPWRVSADELRRALGLRHVVLLNDLHAIAYAVPHLLPSEFTTLNAGKSELHRPLAVVAPGTGLGEAFLVWSGKHYLACSSEGGHSNFGPDNELQSELGAYIRARFGHASNERVCSGPGIANIYDFFRAREQAAESAVFAARLAAAQDRTPLIAEEALSAPEADTLAAKTLRLFVDILAAEASNLALKVLSTGGLYLAGGIPAHILPMLTDGRFMRAFAGKGRFAGMMNDMPVHVVTARAALLGAALAGLDHIRPE